MNKRPGLPARGWLFCGALGLAMVGPLMLHAQTTKQASHNKPAAGSQEPASLAEKFQHQLKSLYDRLIRNESSKSAKPANSAKAAKSTKTAKSSRKTYGPIRQVSGSKTTAQSTPNTKRKKSRVLEELQKLYRRDGRQMPPMSVEELPKTSAEAEKAVRNRSLQSPMARKPHKSHKHHTAHAGNHRPIRQTSGKKRSKPGLFQRLLGLDSARRSGRSSRHTHGAHVPPMPSETPSAVAESKQKPGLLPDFLRSVRTRTKQQQHVHRATASSVTKVKQTAKSAADDGFENPFTEVSEAEADKNLGPYTGLKLDDPNQGKQTPIIRPNPLLVTSAKQKDWRTTTSATHEASAPPIPETDDADLTPDSDHQQKLNLLAERDHRPGFKGFCPVTLRDQRDLVDASPEFSSKYNGKRYHFATAEAKARFDANPENYVPVKNGHDVVVLASGGVELEGSLSHAVWYKERLYLFSSQDTLEIFAANPDEYAVEKASDSSDE